MTTASSHRCPARRAGGTADLLRAPGARRAGARCGRVAGRALRRRVRRIGGEPAAYVDVPVSRAGHLLGILSIDAHQPRLFTVPEVQGVREVGRQLAAVLLRERAKTDLRRRDEILSTVSRAATVLLAGSPWKDAAPGLLESLGRAAQASRAHIFELSRRDEGELTATQRYEWVAAGVRPEIANPRLQDVVLADHGLRDMAELVERNEVYAAHVRELPAEAQALLEPQDVASLLTVPIHVGSEPWGVIGLDECAGERAWSAAEIDALRAASSLLAAAIARERAEAVLREQEQKLQAVFDASFDAIFITDDERRHVDMNPAAAALYGLPREEMLGRRVDEFAGPAQHAGADAGWTRFATEDVVTGEYELPEPDGGVRRVEYSARPNFLPGLNIAFVRDVTERQQLEARLQAAQKLESDGPAGRRRRARLQQPAHRRSAATASSLLEQRAGRRARGDLSEIRRAAERAAELTRQLLAFGRRQVLQPQPLEVDAVVRGVEAMVRRADGRGCRAGRPARSGRRHRARRPRSARAGGASTWP